MNTVSRRGLLKAATWTAPAIAIAAKAPAFATSTPQPLTCAVTGLRMKVPAKKKRWSYTVTVACTARVKGVTVNGVTARKVRSNVWIATLDGKHNVLPVSIVTDAGTISRGVRFQ